jgi:hypothetical protein
MLPCIALLLVLPLVSSCASRADLSRPVELALVLDSPRTTLEVAAQLAPRGSVPLLAGDFPFTRS